jgi:hypothetical protein
MTKAKRYIARFEARYDSGQIRTYTFDALGPLSAEATAQAIARSAGLVLIDVQPAPTHRD